MIGTTSPGISDQLKIYTPYADAVRMLLHINRKFTIVSRMLFTKHDTYGSMSSVVTYLIGELFMVMVKLFTVLFAYDFQILGNYLTSHHIVV